MSKQLFNKKSIRFIVVILGMIIAFSTILFAVNGTLAAPNDIVVNLLKPNNYQEVEKNNDYIVVAGGIKAYDISDSTVAAVAPSGNTIKVTGKKAGVVSVGISSTAGFTAVLNYQIIDSSNISAYIINGGREVSLSGPGKTKPIPVTVTIPATGNPAGTITWKSLQPSIATVNNNTRTIEAKAKGAAILIGEFTDKWGVAQYIPLLVGVGVNVNEVIIGDLSELIELIIKGETILKLEDNPYMPESLGDLQTAVNNGKAIIDTDNPTNTQITNAIKGLKDAIKDLKKIGGGGNVEGPFNGKYYKKVGRPPNVWVKVDEDGEPTKYPPEYVYNPGTQPGDGNDRDAYADGDGNFWVEDPKGSNIWKKVKPDTPNAGTLIDSPAIWGGPDGKFGGGDDLPVTKLGSDYWVSRGQNVWQKVLYPPTSLGELTGGGPNENPSTSGVTPIYEYAGIYYIGPVGTDSDGNQYYYGDSKELGRGNGKVMSTKTQKHYTDDIYYFSNGQMVTENPKTVVSINISPAFANVAKGGTQTFIAEVLCRDGTLDNSGVQWTVSPAGTGTSINLTNGVLTVGAGETNTTLTITARSNKSPTITKTANVIVTENTNAIKSVTITPSSITVNKGNTQQFTAEVRKNDNSVDTAGVTWTVSPAGNGTLIDQNGKLAVGSGETNAVLTVTATSKTDTNVKSTAIVTVSSKPITEVPDVADDGLGNGGRVLTNGMTGDSVNWVEIARNGNYSLIVRGAPIKGKTCFQKTQGNRSYTDSSLRDFINNWFDNILPDNARVRNFTMQNNAKDTCGNTSALNGFSKPTDKKRPFGIDTAFAMSYGESAKFCSVTYWAPSQTSSSQAAKKNFAKIDMSDTWLRSPGSASSGTTGASVGLLGSDGRVWPNAAIEYWYTTYGPYWVFNWYEALPALWVDQAIFAVDY